MVSAMDCQELLARLLIRLGTENGSSGQVDNSSNYVGGEAQAVQELNDKSDNDLKAAVS
jgi:multisite-specific tRNA:(cytosine-C5)-methyltransferase